MMNMHLLNRSGLAAIAAATAFLTTPVLAQDATPVTADPAPIVADTPLPSEPAAAPAATSDTLAPAPKAATRTVKSAKTTRTITRSAAPARPVARTIAPVAVAAAAPAAVPVQTPADPAMVAPIPEPVAPAPAPVAVTSNNDMLPIAGAAGLGLLALAGAAFAIRRRRRREYDEEVMVDEYHEPALSQPLESVPIAEPVSVAELAPVAATAPITARIVSPAAASAFAWDNSPRATAPASAPAPAAGMNRIDAAKRGPTPDNPSASLKKRLARAAFFDQRERMVTAGQAEPMDSMAGLPEAMDPVEPQPVRGADSAQRTTLDRTFQPV